MSKSVILTQEQSAAALAGAKLQIAPENSSIVIEGSAGTGKSTLLRHLRPTIDNVAKTFKLLDPNWKESEVVFTGTTHKACHNLKDIIDDNNVRTIYSLLGLRVVKDYKTGKSELKRSMGAKTISNALIVVDEAGYLDRDTIGKLYKYTEKCKFIFVGDPNQLAPVGYTNTPIFNAGIDSYKLSQIMRQGEGTPLQELCIALSKTVEGGPWPKLKADNETIFHVDRDTFHEMIIEEYPNWKNQEYTSKVLAWTNRRVEEYNKYLKSALEDSPSFKAGDYVVTNRPIQNSIHNIGNNTELVIGTITPDTSYDVEGFRVTLRDQGYVELFLPADYRDQAKVERRLRKEEDWDALAFIDKFWVDLRSEYACTVNKSQGSTYHTVYIDLDDIGKCKNTDNLKRMLYVAASRAQHRVVFTGDIG